MQADMQSDLDAFSHGLADLRLYIGGYMLEEQLLSLNLDDYDQSGSTILLELLEQYQQYGQQVIAKRRRFHYSSVIVSMYGYLEQFIEGLLKGYVRYLNEIVPTYKELPDRICKHHIDLSFGLIDRVRQSRYRGSITVQQLISNLHSCESNLEPYDLNIDAFAHHTANFRSAVVQKCFARIGVEGIPKWILSTSVFQEYEQRKDLGPNPRESFPLLDDLAERRNEVAHGTPPEDILSNNDLFGHIEFLEVYGRAIHEVVTRHALPFQVKHKGTELGRPLCVFHSGTSRSVIGLALQNCTLRVGDLLIARPDEQNALHLSGEIQELQVDNISHKTVKSCVDVGVEVPFKAKENQTIFHIASDDNI